MGYYTDYHMYIRGSSEKMTALKESIANCTDEVMMSGHRLSDIFNEEVSIHDDLDYGDDHKTLFLSGTAKWYVAREDIDSLALQNPDIYYNLHGRGEERDDEWDYWCFNGDSDYQMIHIIHPETHIEYVPGVEGIKGHPNGEDLPDI